MNFKRTRFDFRNPPVGIRLTPEALRADPRSGIHYEFDDRIELAVNAALETKRPLLVEGTPGTGKSTLAPAIARRLGWWFYDRVITSRTTAQDLLYEFDALGRLHDAQMGRPVDDAGAYVVPGPLWWAFDPEAARRHARSGDPANPTEPGDQLGNPSPANAAVVLLDEIDKADPDVPNDLLVPLGSNRFAVKETGEEVSTRREFLLVITTNGERSLARAFIRRCIRLELKPHDAQTMVKIASWRFGIDEGQRELSEQIAELAQATVAMRDEARPGERLPSTAEFLDAVAAVTALGPIDSAAWKELLSVTLNKPEPRRP